MKNASLCIAAILALSSVNPVFAQSPMIVKGTRVSVVKPEGFIEAKNFTGFQRNDTGATVMVTEMAAPYEKVTEGFNQQGMASQGMTLVSKQLSSVNGMPAMFVEATQAARGVVFRKYMLAFGDQSKAVIVTGTFPDVAAGEMANVVRNSVLSARYNASAPAPDAYAGIPFTISGTKNLKLATRVQNSLVFNRTGRPQPSGDPTVFVVAPSVSNVRVVGDAAAFARSRLTQTDNIRDVHILSETNTQIAGLPTREIMASGYGKKGEALFLLQYIVYSKDGYYIMQGFSDLNARASFEPEFRAIASTFRPK